MKKLYIIFFLAFSFSCQDVLDLEPLDQPSDVTFFSNQDQLELALNGAYTDLWWLSDVNAPMQVNLDNATDLGFLRANFTAGGLISVSNGLHSPEEGVFGGTWDKMYRGISKANNLLENMERAEDEVPAEAFAQIEAEALFLRSYYYSWLIALFGDVPWLEEVPAVEDSYIGKTAKSEIVQFLYRDLDLAVQDLPDDAEGLSKASKGTALALKARIAHEAGDYQTAANAAEQVIDLNKYQLHDDYEELFTYDGTNSPEIILKLPYATGLIEHRIPWYQTSRNTGGVSTNVPSQFIVDSYESIDGLPIDESPLYDPANPFENRDPRLDASIIRPQSIWGGYVFETHPDSVETSRLVDDEWVRVRNNDVTNPFATFTGYLWKKYTSEADIPGLINNSTLEFILMRYAEVLLIYAESKIELNQIDNSVLDALNQVRARAYQVDITDVDNYPEVTTNDQAELRKIVRRERKVELANEGFRLLDIRRWGIAEDVMQGTLVGRPKGYYGSIPSAPEIDENGHPNYGANLDLYRAVEQRIFNPEKDYLWPIPQKEVDVNENINQNPGY
jgi:hypothetical protein